MAESGERYWGRFGAAGILAVDAARGVLMQHRVSWSHFGGTWGLPGGARHQGESALDGALREAQEEAGIPDGALRARFSSVLDLGIWSYTTVVADVVESFEPVISDPESVALEWVPIDEVDARPLHPGFADAWPRLRELLKTRPAVVIDVANVIGSVPDGWWKDRAGAADRLLDRVDAWRCGGLSGPGSGLGADRWYPEVVVVVEGAARAVPGRSGGLRLVRAEGHGDDAVIAEATRLVGAGATTIVATSDRGLQARAVSIGARVESAGWLLRELDGAPA